MKPVKIFGSFFAALLVMPLVVAEQKQPVPKQEGIQQAAWNAMHRQLMQPLNMQVLNISMFSRRMPSEMYRAEIASTQPASGAIEFTLTYYQENVGKVKPGESVVSGSRTRIVGKAVYDVATKKVMVEAGGRRLSPEEYIRVLKAGNTT